MRGIRQRSLRRNPPLLSESLQYPASVKIPALFSNKDTGTIVRLQVKIAVLGLVFYLTPRQNGIVLIDITSWFRMRQRGDELARA